MNEKVRNRNKRNVVARLKRLWGDNYQERLSRGHDVLHGAFRAFRGEVDEFLITPMPSGVQIGDDYRVIVAMASIDPFANVPWERSCLPALFELISLGVIPQEQWGVMVEAALDADDAARKRWKIAA
jgi:hypothetical protein